MQCCKIGKQLHPTIDIRFKNFKRKSEPLGDQEIEILCQDNFDIELLLASPMIFLAKFLY
jgi:hypothetical protein